MEMTIATAMPTSLAKSRPPVAPISYWRIQSKHSTACHVIFRRLKEGTGIHSEVNKCAAYQSRTVTRCNSHGVQLQASSPPLNAAFEISKESTGVSLQVAQSSNLSRERLDSNGRFRSPRAARELALLVLYAACMEGSNPLRVFERRLNMKNTLQTQLDQTSLQDYNHMQFSGDPLFVETEDQARMRQMEHDEESSKEATILAAPLKLVYNKFVLSMTRKILEAVVERWDQQASILDQVIPSKWKNESNGRILEVCLLHLTMAEITVLGTRYQVTINEAIDLAKRFCDGAAPRIINGCLRSFIEKENIEA